MLQGDLNVTILARAWKTAGLRDVWSVETQLKRLQRETVLAIKPVTILVIFWQKKKKKCDCFISLS